MKALPIIPIEAEMKHSSTIKAKAYSHYFKIFSIRIVRSSKQELNV
jgi:hypothetical protein